MRMKRDDGRGPPQLERALDDAAHQLLMADVHAIEIADRRDTAAREIGLAKRVLEDEHRVGGRSLTELVERRPPPAAPKDTRVPRAIPGPRGGAAPPVHPSPHPRAGREISAPP